jgi:uncharacterized protein GlcG (DUF336 family)
MPSLDMLDAEAALGGGVPIHVEGEAVGAVGVAGSSKETDTEIANTAAAKPAAKLMELLFARSRRAF